MQQESYYQESLQFQSHLDEILVRLIAVPLALACGPPGLPVLDPVLDSSDHCEHILPPLGLPGCLGWQLRYELHVGEGAKQLLDGVVGDGVWSAQVGEWLVLYRN